MIGLIFIFLIILIGVFFPEVTLTFFLFAGAFKADPRVEFLASIIDPTLLFLIASFSGLVYQSTHSRMPISLPTKKLLIPWYLFSLVLLVGLFYTPSEVYGTQKTLLFFTTVSFALLSPSFLLNDNVKFHRFAITVIAFSLCYAVLSVKANLTSNGSYSYEYVSGFEGSNYLMLGRVTGISALFCFFHFYLRTKDIRSAIIFVFAGFFMLYSVTIAGGRGPLVGFIVSIIITLAFVIYFKRRYANYSYANVYVRRILLLSVILFCVGTLAATFYRDQFERMTLRLELLTTSEGGESASERVKMIAGALRLLDSPQIILVGTGIGGFSVGYLGIDQRAYPHNIFLETAVELGIVALCALCAWIIFSLTRISSAIKAPHNFLCFALLVFSLFNASVSGDFNDNRFFFFTLGLIFTNIEMQEV